jgi:hypothetical protein
MPQSVGYGEAEILRVGIRPGEACPPSDWPSVPVGNSNPAISIVSAFGQAIFDRDVAAPDKPDFE